MLSNIIAVGLPLIISIFCFLFLFWRRTKEDYPSNDIFEVATSMLILSGVVSSLTIYAIYKIPSFPLQISASSILFWVFFIVSVLVVWFFSKKKQMSFIELLDSSIFSYLLSFFVIVSSHALYTKNPRSLILSGVIGFVFILYIFLDERYKSFSWYKSGKVGFAGLFSAGVFFVSRAILALSFKSMTTILGPIDVLLSSLVAFAFFLMLYNIATK